MSQDESYDPSPPTFKPPQRLKGFRRRRPANSPPPDLTQWRLANSRSAPLLVPQDSGEAPVRVVQSPEAPVAVRAGVAKEGATKVAGFHPAVAAAWAPRASPGVVQPLAEHPLKPAQAGESRRDDTVESSLPPLTPSYHTVPAAPVSDYFLEPEDAHDNDENRPPPPTTFRSLAPPGWRTLSDAPDRNDELPASVDEIFANVIPKTRQRLDDKAKKRRGSASFVDAVDVPAPKRKKRRIPPWSPSYSWEEHDLTLPEATFPPHFSVPRAPPPAQRTRGIYLGPNFLGAYELEALSPPARNRLLQPPHVPRLELGSSPSASALVRDLDAARMRKGARRGRHGRGAGPGFEFGEGPPRLAPGRAANGAFLDGVQQTGFAGVRDGQRRGGGRERAAKKRAPQRLLSVRDLGTQLGRRALLDAPAREVKPLRARRAGTAKLGRKPRLRIGTEDEAGDVGELDERAADFPDTIARPLPPHRKPGMRPSTRPLHFRFAPPRRPPPRQLISFRAPPVDPFLPDAALFAEQGRDSLGKVNATETTGASASRSARKRQSSFRFVVGPKAKKSRTVDAAAAVEEDRDSAGWEGGEPALDGEALPANERTGADVARVATPQPVGDDEGSGAPGGKRLMRRVSTYGDFLLVPRLETDPIEDKDTQRLPATSALDASGGGGEPTIGETHSHDIHESSHSYRGGASRPSRATTPPCPAPAPAKAPATVDFFSPLSSTLPLPPAQQPHPLPSIPSLSRSPSSTSSFDRSACVALDNADVPPDEVLNPPDLILEVDDAVATTSPASSGLALRIPPHTPHNSFPYSAPPVPSASGVGPTLPSDEEGRALSTEVVPEWVLAGELKRDLACEHEDEDEQEQELEQASPTSAILASSFVPPNLPVKPSPHSIRAGADEDDDDVFAADVQFTALAVAERTRRMLQAAAPAPAPAPPAKRELRSRTVQMMLTPPESTRKPARRRRTGRA